MERVNKVVEYQKLCQSIDRILLCEGVDPQEASIITRSLVWSDLIGRSGHGVERLPAYLERFRKNLIKSPCNPQFVQKSETIYLVEGGDGFGHYLGHIAMLKAIDTARQYGVGLVGVNHSNHYGAGAYYVQLAAQELQVGFAFSNSFPKVAPPGGMTAALGTNPFAFAAPTRNRQSIIVDFATSASAGSTIRKALENHQEIPEGILANEREGSIGSVILPFGGAKGFCLGLMVEILSGVMTGAGISHEIASLYKNFERSANIGHFFLTLDISKFMAVQSYYERIEKLIAYIKGVQPNISGEEIMIPGENRWRNYYEQIERGIELESKTIDSLNRLAERLNIADRV